MKRGLAALALALACTEGAAEGEPETTPSDGAETPSETDRARVSLRELEAELLGGAVVGTPPWSRRGGAEPFHVERLDGDIVGLLRHEGQLVVLGEDGSARETVPGPALVTGLARRGARLWAVGEGSAEVHAYSFGGRLMPHEAVRIEGAHALRDVASGGTGDGAPLYVTDPFAGRLLRIDPPGDAEVISATKVMDCPGANSVDRWGSFLVVNCLLAHRVHVLEVDDQGLTTDRSTSVQHDGPIWSVGGRVVDGVLHLALGGVEDRPLDRSDGAFGYIDSFLFTETVSEDTFERGTARALNLGAHGVVTPKWVGWRDDATILVTGAGGERAATVRGLVEGNPEVTTRPVPAGLTALVGDLDRGLAANPLLDRWVRLDVETISYVGEDARGDSRTEDERLGEALAFTTLMAARGTSDGRRSRFTCETCHFEGRGDGRTHHTGRGEVHATTKTLRGLVGNRPHFTRALDRDTTTMVFNEFDVANRKTGHDAWFELSVVDHPWLAELTSEQLLSPEDLRRALLSFLAAYAPERNPAAAARADATFTEAEAQGADTFERHCESCHGARTQTDDPATRVPRAQWASHIFGAGDLVWATAPRVKTGVEPYVHDEGARPPSLRRLWVKYPYFTNGSARSLDAVLERVGTSPAFSHAAPEGTLTLRERADLRAFLDLL